jgi:hypothetical protein
MVQCHGGGFLSNVAGNTNQPNWTFASASSWQETAKSSASFLTPGGTRQYLNNFTRPWREDALLYTNSGMLQHFQTAANGRAAAGQILAIAKDPFVPPKPWQYLRNGVLFPNEKYPTVSGTYNGTAGVWAWFGGNRFYQAMAIPNTPNFNVQLPQFPAPITFAPLVGDGSEHPQYSSSSAASDGRTLSPGTNFQVYAVLVAWGRPEPRHAANIARIYRTLVDSNGVPARNIAVLIGDGTFNATTNLGLYLLLPAPNGAVTENLASVPISSDSGANSFSNALAGAFFGSRPGANDRLLVYNTGHGGLNGEVRGMGWNTNGWYVTLAAGFDAPAVVEDALSGLVDSGQDLNNFVEPTVTLQLAMRAPITAPEVLVNDVSLQAVQSSLVLVTAPNGSATATNLIYDLDPVAPGALTNDYIYQADVPVSLLLTPDGTIQITLVGLQPPNNFDPGLFDAFVVDGGDEQAIYLAPDLTAVGKFTAWPYGDYALLTWPPPATDYIIEENPDLFAPTNWTPLRSPLTGKPEITGTPDPAFPAGTNWLLVSSTNPPQMFFRLRRSTP